jgi:hypothetical protein
MNTDIFDRPPASVCQVVTVHIITTKVDPLDIVVGDDVWSLGHNLRDLTNRAKILGHNSKIYFTGIFPEQICRTKTSGKNIEFYYGSVFSVVLEQRGTGTCRSRIYDYKHHLSHLPNEWNKSVQESIRSAHMEDIQQPKTDVRWLTCSKKTQVLREFSHIPQMIKRHFKRKTDDKPDPVATAFDPVHGVSEMDIKYTNFFKSSPDWSPFTHYGFPFKSTD